MPAVLVENVSKSFRRHGAGGRPTTLKSALVKGIFWNRNTPRFQAIEDVSFEVEKGTTFGIVGPNGAGKSTLLKLIAGIYKPDAGRIEVKGKVSTIIDLGTGFHPDFSGMDNIFVTGALLGFSRKQLKTLSPKIVEFAELEEFIHEPVRTYSRGMYARLGFSIAVHVDPDILLIDEVLAVGDAGFKKKCLGRIQEFKNAGKTIIHVSHNPAVIKRFCDKAILLENKRVKMIGSAEEVVDSYLQKFQSIMNILDDVEDVLKEVGEVHGPPK